MGKHRDKHHPPRAGEAVSPGERLPSAEVQHDTHPTAPAADTHDFAPRDIGREHAGKDHHRDRK